MVFSVPHQLVPLLWQNKKVLFKLLFEASAATLLEVAADPRHLGAEIGFLSVLHTWGQTLPCHPHVHCVVPGGGLSCDHQRWISSPPNFFLPVKVLSRVFRGKFLDGLRNAFRSKRLAFYGSCHCWENRRAFYAFLDTLEEHDWVVYAKKPFGGPEHVLHYLARYTHRVAISNHRLVDVTDTDVTFRWKDYAHHSKRRTMTLSHQEFLRRFLQHVLPRSSNGSPRSNFGRKIHTLIALNACSLPLSRCAFGYAFLDVCLHAANPRFSALRHALSNPLKRAFHHGATLIAPRESLLCPESSGKIGIQNP